MLKSVGRRDHLAMSSEGGFTVCPKCGGQAKVTSSTNPIRNVIRDHIRCPRCGFEKTVERPPEVTLADWLRGKTP